MQSVMWVWLRVDNGFEIPTNSQIKQGLVAEIIANYYSPFLEILKPAHETGKVLFYCYVYNVAKDKFYGNVLKIYFSAITGLLFMDFW